MQVEGITLSPKQVERGMELASERGLGNVQLKVMDALAMDYPDNSFDLVWACESGEHMPDKVRAVKSIGAKPRCAPHTHAALCDVPEAHR
jgi:MPBQ/MSBQ methyltransferase